MICLVTKFIWNLVIYCGKEEVPSTIGPVTRKEPKLTHKVVLKLSKDIKGKRHIIAMDNLFTSIRLFKDLALTTIYAMETMRSN
jgi:hypothetical protein